MSVILWPGRLPPIGPPVQHCENHTFRKGNLPPLSLLQGLHTMARFVGSSKVNLCVPKTLSGFFAQQNRLNWRDDRADLFCSGRAGLAVQVEEQARGGECGAPTSADRFAAQGEGSSPAYQRRPLVPRPDVSMVSIDPDGRYDCPT